MNHPIAFLNFLADYNSDNSPGYNFTSLALVFAFVIILAALRTFRRIQQQKQWHETVRLSLEKGQPLPPAVAKGMPRGGQRYRGTWPLCRGLVWIAVGVGLYLVNSTGAHKWAPLPICVGVALLIIGTCNMACCRKDDDPQNPPAPQ